VSSSASFHRYRGRVVSFDDASGLGIVATDDGTSHMFHCVSIADGTRSIAVGSSVSFVLVNRHGGIEAADVVYADDDAQR
jgi:cold shock CspA family protein